jgi:hypothetical protein
VCCIGCTAKWYVAPETCSEWDTVYVNNKHVMRSIANETMSCHPHLNADVTGTSVNYEIVQTCFVLRSP